MTAPMRWAFAVKSVPFTQDVIDGRSSLGGSESSCLGLARALVARGHDVHLFAGDLQAPPQIDLHGVKWHPLEQLRTDYLHWTWDVYVGLRLVEFFAAPVSARMRILWGQDLLLSSGLQADQPAAVMSHLWGVDHIAYVSAFHRAQWESVMPDARGLGWVTRNSYDPADLPSEPPARDPYRIIHINRPERGLAPLLAMWPELRRRVPQATLAICRYSSMYDAQGWGRVCASFDEEVQAVNAAVGGITYLGELNKADLYREIAASAVMWYPGVVAFAETSCIAAIEAQACGTPLVASYKGALPETAPHALLIDGDAMTPEYQAQSIAAVAALLGQDASLTFRTRHMVTAGRRHVEAYTHDAVAAHWEQAVEGWFAERATNRDGVIAALMREDDHVAARAVLLATSDPSAQDMGRLDYCERVIAGEDMNADDYARLSLPDPVTESETDSRQQAAADILGHCQHLLDIGCGNGAFAIYFARTHPQARVTAIDYSQGNIDKAIAGAQRAGVADRVTFICAPVYDFATHQPADLSCIDGQTFDGLFLGEILEHLVNGHALVDALEPRLQPGATVLVTVPHGPWSRLQTGTPKCGHVHHFHIDDVLDLFGAKSGLYVSALHYGQTARAESIGQWLIAYQTDGTPTGQRDLARRIGRIRPLPRLSVGLITYNAANDLKRCLESVRGIADEIVIGDTGSTDETIAIAERMGARVVSLPPVMDDPDGFAGARNRVLDVCTGDWFLWIDADEVLDGAAYLPSLIETGPFVGYAIHQNHLMLDTPMTKDTPVRLFRRLPSIRFYGCVHEQPQMGDANTDITPALQIADTQIAHYGYRTERIRRGKADRNYPLMLRSRERFPTRELNWVIELRECVIRANDLVSRTRTMSPEAAGLYAQACRIYEAKFSDPAHKYHQIARAFYEDALQHHDECWEVEYAFAAKPVKLDGRARPKRLKARTPEQIEAEILHDVRKAFTYMRAKAPLVQPVAGTPATIDAALVAGMV